MSMQDPISDMLTRVRNGFMSKKDFVTIPFSIEKKAIAKVLFKEGFIDSFDHSGLRLRVRLKYYKNSSVIKVLKRVSRPSLRVYNTKKLIQKIYGSVVGVAIISTSKGIMSHFEAKKIMLAEKFCAMSSSKRRS